MKEIGDLEEYKVSTRIISAVVATALAVVLLILHSTPIFNIAIGLISACALFELFRAVGVDKNKHHALSCYIYAVVDAIMPWFLNKGWLTFFTYKCYMGIFVLTMCILFLKEHNTVEHKDLIFMLGSAILIPYSFGTIVSMSLLGGEGVFLIVLSLCAAWLADSGAYFAGTFFGKHKLCPEISPKKTIEGVAGGVVCNGIFMLIISFVYSKINSDITINYIGVFIAGMIAAIIGLVGDLTASVIKRQTGIKDYGNIMPGHGGVLDRFDSVLLVAPFMFYMISQGWIIKYMPIF